MNPTFEFIQLPGHQESFCAAVWEGLSRKRKSLPCRYLYDRDGSALFEKICELPEYYLTRTEQAILERHAGEMVEAAGAPLSLVEFGSGSSYKTRILINAILSRQPSLHYVPIDISADFLHLSCTELLAIYPSLSITAVAAEYSDGIAAIGPREGARLALFLGSNIGNFEPNAARSFLAGLASALSREDSILMGVDLVKDRRILEAAYNDAAKVTAAFNRNLLARINRELGGNFRTDRFDHAAPYNDVENRIEMLLVSSAQQTVTIGALDYCFHFEQGEAIHTENSHKYTVGGFDKLCKEAGLRLAHSWTDSREWFAVLLLKPID
ncbi:MAG TPA: L-histidine N(alpha)-methyltransferase [Chthonomonadales bacterium]|nr:L-histidine N(alpha)-methyltransferase [Chthonomonadales bacterium]